MGSNPIGPIMMKLKGHKITDKSPDSKFGTCSECGLVDITLDGRCGALHRERARINYLKKTLEERRAQRRNWAANNKEKNILIHRRSWYRSNYGIEPEEFDAKFDEQNRVCGICGTDDPGGHNWHLDHDHKFEKKDPRGHRGVLCFRCNSGIGSLKEDIEILEKAIQYLRRYQS